MVSAMKSQQNWYINMFINRERLISLLMTELRFEALECGGVDNWRHYSDSINYYIDSINRDFETDFDNFRDIANYLIDNDMYNG